MIMVKIFPLHRHPSISKYALMLDDIRNMTVIYNNVTTTTWQVFHANTCRYTDTTYYLLLQSITQPNITRLSVREHYNPVAQLVSKF